MSEAISHARLLELVNAASQGRRPHFFADADVDRLLSIVWAMAGELAVTRERLDTVERLLARRDLVERDEIETFRPNDAEAAERGRLQIEYIARLLRVLQHEADALARGGDAEPSAEEMSTEVDDK